MLPCLAVTLTTRALIFNISALLTVCATGAMQWWGTVHSFYYLYPWWDMPAHFLGGLTIGLWMAAVATRLALSPRRHLLLLLGVTLCVGAAWEVWEYVEGLEGGYEGYLFGTYKDISFDVLGALAGWFLYLWSYRTRR